MRVINDEIKRLLPKSYVLLKQVEFYTRYIYRNDDSILNRLLIAVHQYAP